MQLCFLFAPIPGTLLCSALNPVSLPISMDCLDPSSLPNSMDYLEPMFIACFYEKLGILILCLFLWSAKNPVSLPVSMDWSDYCTFARFYGLIEIQHLCLFRWIGSLPAFMKSSEPWSSPVSRNSHVLAAKPKSWAVHMLGTLVPLSALIGTRRLCLILWTARNPASLPTIMKSSDPWFFACF